MMSLILDFWACPEGPPTAILFLNLHYSVFCTTHTLSMIGKPERAARDAIRA